MRINPAFLGATLYMPATRDDLVDVASGARYPDLRSLVVCLEDSIRDDQVDAALTQFRRFLSQLRLLESTSARRPYLFVRPRDAFMLQAISAMTGLDLVDGFVIPKATAKSLPDYLSAISLRHHLIMPTIETREAFDPVAMRRLRDQLRAVHDHVLAVRIGGNDLLQTIGARRSTTRTAYDGPLGLVIANIATTFIPWGFAVSAPVLECYADAALLTAEVERDLEHGLITKTVAHPSQIAPIHRAYEVSAADYDAACAILKDDAPAVFGRSGVMTEPATHRGWAECTLTRAETFGVRIDTPTLSLVS
jgi:citrate lyase beta subunit